MSDSDSTTTDPDGRRVVFDGGSQQHLALGRRGWLLDHLELILGAVEAPDHREDDPVAWA